MGNICGKTESDNFSSPGRTVGSVPPDPSVPKTAPVPRKVGGPPRTLGGGPDSQPTKPTAGAADTDARRRAAEAAEARAKAANKPGGKLQSQLNAQKKQTRTDTLQESSNQELRSREADEAAKMRNWD
ncbi:hypothetical protein V2G26_014557 [Clonostachys chloroleuca]|uniref:Uncharacterized protein n=1 Tax=Clonostachys chloroleuca TaxID=1926264 RepID=A0AA35MF87_9HYPO|nr:unnamed protein product [Clonostachys chloroleuca]